MSTSATSVITLNAVLDQLADMVAERVAARLCAPTTADYYDQHKNPLGKRRFLESARRGDFPSTKQGKLVLARRADVDRWLDSRERPRAESRTEGSEEGLDALLLGAGIVGSGMTSPRRGKR